MICADISVYYNFHYLDSELNGTDGAEPIEWLVCLKKEWIY